MNEQISEGNTGSLVSIYDTEGKIKEQNVHQLLFIVTAIMLEAILYQRIYLRMRLVSLQNLNEP